MHPRKTTFDAELVEMAGWTKALAHPARLEILRVLARRRECICGEVVDELPLAQSTVSQHLKELKAAGLVRGTVDGPRVCYCIDAKTIERVRAAIGSFLESLDAPPSSCC